MERIKHSNELITIPNIIMVNGEVIKNRNNVRLQDIPMEMIHRNEVLIKQGDHMYCFMSKRKKEQIKKLILKLKELDKDYSNYILFR